MSSLPSNISDLIERFKTSKDNEEKDALKEWCKTATNQILTPFEIPKCPWEMARLAEVLSDENPRNLGNFENLVRHFVNAIIDGTTDGTALNPILWRCMAHIIRHGDGKLSNGVLGPLFQSLMDRLDKAKKQGNFEVQYEFTCVLGTVVDAMADIGVSSISHGDMHKRLLDTLKSLKESEELHLAHAAEYASQALSGIPDDDTTFKALLRGFIRTTDIAMSVFGAASSPDPGKIWTAIKDTVKGVLDLEEHLYDRLRQYTGKSWYTALRTTRAFIGTRNIEGLVTFIKEAECREDPKFLCGLYFQLEQLQATPDMHSVRLYDHIPSSKDSRVQAWSEFSKNDCNGSGEVKIRHWAFKKLKEDTFQFSLKASAIENITPSNDEWPSFLFQAFTRCILAKKYYAKAELERYYMDENSGRLMIQRLSNDVLSMDQCYINLEVQDTSAGDEISLPKLFEPRKGDNGRMIHPKRIFIEGQAGVGKTTLCKKIVHDFLHHQQWSRFIDCILWLPLRNLKRISNSYTLKDVFQKQFFSHHRECETLAQTMTDVVGAGDDRLLIILDGFDEIAQDWNPDDPMDRIFKQLLKHPRVIISSRPNHASKLQTQQLDLRLNTVGFSPDQIEKYIHAPGIMDNREIAGEIYSFIEAHPRMLELAHIPVQLDAICYSWEDLCNTFRPGDTPQTMTMTMIYTAVANRLFRKDLARQGERLTEDAVDGKTDSEVENDMEIEIGFLEGLAFHGFLANIIEFDHPTKERIKQHLPNIKTEENKLKQLSLFRTSDTTLSKKYQNFHFIHLTFQEYFAARYYVKHQCRDKSIHLHPESTTDRQMSPQALLAQHKYTTRYNMFWRFVAGYLYIQADNPAVGERPLNDFFRTMEAEPRDIFGPTHQRRVMYCLDEVPKSRFEFESQREVLHKQLCGWVTFESQYYLPSRSLWLTAEREFPDSVLCRLMQDENLSTKNKIPLLLARRQNVSIEVTNIVASWLDRCKWISDSEGDLVALLLYNANGLSETALDILVRKLQCNEVWGMLSHFGPTWTPSIVYPVVFDIFIDKLSVADSKIRKKALIILSHQPILALESVVDHLAGQIRGNGIDIIKPTVAALNRIP